MHLHPQVVRSFRRNPKAPCQSLDWVAGKLQNIRQLPFIGAYEFSGKNWQGYHERQAVGSQQHGQATHPTPPA